MTLQLWITQSDEIMRAASGQIHRTSMIGLLAAVAAIVLGVGIYRVFFFRPVDAREIGWVLEVTGDGWSLKSDSSRLLKVGDRLPAGGILVPKSKDSKTTITICDFEGNPNFYVGTDGSQVLPAATLNNLATKLWQRVADRYDSKDIHAISRGDDDLHLHSGIGVQSAQGPVDLSTVLMNLPKSTYVLQFKGIGTRLSPSPTASAECKIAWDPKEVGALQAQTSTRPIQNRIARRRTGLGAD